MQKLERFDIVSTVRAIGSNAFLGCTSLKGICVVNVKTFGDRCFSGCSMLQYLHFGREVSLGKESFFYCDSLVRVTFCGNSTLSSSKAFSSSLCASVPIWYDGDDFGGLTVIRILDSSCNFPSYRFTDGAYSPKNAVTLFAIAGASNEE